MTVETTWPHDVHTLAVDVGGSGLKASVLASDGSMLLDRVRIDTPYPCPPETLVEALGGLTAPLLAQVPAQRASVGVPGMVRHGCVVNITPLARLTYDGPRDLAMADRWMGFDLGQALAEVFEMPTKVVNDADMQGCAVVTGEGTEFVLTLGTGIGTALFSEGRLLPHMELSHGPFRDGLTTDVLLGNVNRKVIGNQKWRKRVREAIEMFDAMLWFDRLYVGGGNAKHVSPEDIGPKGQIVPNSAGIVGGVRVWDLDR
jgi:polyphosphate glucokinase